MTYFKQFLEDLISVGYSYIPPSSSGVDGYTVASEKNDFIRFISNKDIFRAEQEASKLRMGFIKGDYYVGFTEDSPDGYKPSQLKYEHFIYCLKEFVKWSENSRIIKKQP